jgi:hypothetical protein
MRSITIKGLKSLAIIWFITITILFFLPGSALPKEGWLNSIHFDKWVHFGFFALLVFLFRFYFPGQLKYNWFILLFASVYGLGVEIIQHNFITSRSFDTGDVVADIVGSIAGLLIWSRYIKK